MTARYRIFKAILIFSVVAGCFFRLFALDKKSYWFDETFTSLRISGYTDRDLIDRFSQNDNLISPAELRKYQSSTADSSTIATIRGLALEEPQNPPLYFVLAKLWADQFGSSITMMRALPAVISLISLPMIYLLCFELFKSAAIAWLAVALIAISPFHVLLAQTARPQSLWIVGTILVSYALLRALRTQRFGSWGLYVCASLLSLYTFVLSGLYLFGFAIYVLVVDRFRVTRAGAVFLACTVLAGLGFLPWLFLLLQSRSNIAATTSWVNSRLSSGEWTTALVTGFVRLFYDVNNQSSDRFIDLIPFFAVVCFVFILVAVSIGVSLKHNEPKVRYFLLALVTSSLLPLIILDAWNDGGRLTAANRYLIPAYLGVQLSISFFLGRDIFHEGGRGALSRVLTVVVLALGIISCAVSSRSEAWWNKDPDGSNQEIARVVNRSASPILVSDGWLGHVLSLSAYLEDRVKLRIEPLCYVCFVSLNPRTFPETPEAFSDVFYFHPGWEPGSYIDVTAQTFQPVVSYRGRVLLWKRVARVSG